MKVGKCLAYIVGDDSVFKAAPLVRFSEVINSVSELVEAKRGN
jgi:hypothetical protein